MCLRKVYNLQICVFLMGKDIRILLRESLSGLRKNFVFGFRLAERRAVLARRRVRDYQTLMAFGVDYKRFPGKGLGFEDALCQLVGYAVGNYTTFCPTQLDLDLFDNLIEGCS